LSIHSNEISGFLAWWNHERSASKEIQSQVLVMINSSLSPARQIWLFIHPRRNGFTWRWKSLCRSGLCGT